VKTDKPEEGMSKKRAIQLMSLLASAVMGPEQFEKSSDAFQLLVFSSAGMMDDIEKKGIIEVMQTIDETTVDPVMPMNDCETLSTLINALQQAFAELCPIA
jgi:hypothetical protein